jgi:hypothetical protein
VGRAAAGAAAAALAAAATLAASPAAAATPTVAGLASGAEADCEGGRGRRYTGVRTRACQGQTVASALRQGAHTQR